MTAGERILNRRVMATTARVENILKKELSVQWFSPNKEDAIRLLILAQWEERYRVSVTQILLWLVPFWRERFTKFKKQKGIGVSISTLVGKKSEEILQQKMAAEFPASEHLVRWKVQEQQRQWASARDKADPKEDWEFPGTMVQAYQARMRSERRVRNQFAREQKKKPYRGNPWT